MKKSKIILVSALAFVLCFMCVTSTTFSWFSRPQTKTGDTLIWDNMEYSASDGQNISITTYASNDDGETYDESTPITSFSETSGIAAGERKYYRTDITNTGDAAQNVSLYLSTLEFPTTSTKATFYLGVNGPVKTYKSYGPNSSSDDSSYSSASSSTMRVYFQPKSSLMSEPDVNWKGKNYYVCYGTDVDGSDHNYLALSETPESGTYYADIPVSATQLFFSVQDWTASYQRTQTFTDIKGDGQSQTSSLVFYLTGGYTEGYDNAYAEKTSASGANIVNYYKSVTIAVGDTFSAALTNNSDYIGGSIAYTSGNTSVFTVSGGEITANAVGTATLTTTVTGSSYSDTMKVTTTVNVVAASPVTYSYTDVPIVTNLKVAAAGTDANGITNNTTESVYWYIKNDSGASALKYTIDDLYLTL